ncbi:MAG: glycosyltransferase family 4 protein [Candidatus Omnitrophica bacterium]|nr:glycosyltransferase family 4 protein [Candidatus Omnitrophota bacterium]
MKIAVDYQSVRGKKTGIGVAAQNLVEAIREEAPEIEWLFYSRPKDDLSAPERIFWESIELPLKTWIDKPDFLYSPGFAPPILGSVPSVVTVHDLIGIAFPGNQRGFSAFYWSVWLPAAVRRARKVIASSEWTRRGIEKYLKVPAGRVSVVPLGVDAAFKKAGELSDIASVLARQRIEPPFLISVGTLEPRKNHLCLLRAYDMLRQRGKNRFSLVIVGKDGGTQRLLRAFVKERGLERNVRLLGYIDRRELVALYNAAWGYVMISLYEGFGLPALEAMSCGVSGICSNRTSLPEVVGDTAILVDPENAGEIADAMDRFCEDSLLRNRLSKDAWERSKQFSMTRCARQMVEIFKNEIQE